MLGTQIENPRGFDLELDMEPDIKPLMKNPIDKQGCIIKVAIIGDHRDNQQIYLSVDTKFETTTLILNKTQAVKIATMLYEKAEELKISRETDINHSKNNEKP